MDVFTQHKSLTKPRLITHRGIFIKAKKNTTTCSEVTNLKLYTTESQNLLTGFPQKLIEDHHFNQQVAVIAPNIDHEALRPLSQLIEAAIGALHTYLLEADLFKLLTPSFISQYLAHPSPYKLYALSTNTSLSSCNAMAIAGGRLWLSIDKETYQTLGISSSYVVIEDKYVLHQDLTSLSSTQLAHLQWCLSAERIGTIQLAVFCTKGNLPQEITFPEGVTVVRKLKASYGDGTHAGSCTSRTELVPDLSFLSFVSGEENADSEDSGAVANTNKQKATSEKKKAVGTTDEDFMSFDMDSGSEGDASDMSDDDAESYQGGVHAFQKAESLVGLDLAMQQTWSWLGMVTARADAALSQLKATADATGVTRAKVDKDNLMVLSDPMSSLSVKRDNVSICRARQLIPPCTVAHIAKHARALVASGKTPWSAVICWGVRDTPCVYASVPHGHSHGVSGHGESSYAIVFLSQDRYAVFWGVDAHSKVM